MAADGAPPLICGDGDPIWGRCDADPKHSAEGTGQSRTWRRVAADLSIIQPPRSACTVITLQQGHCAEMERPCRS